MAWRIEYTPAAEKQLLKLGPEASRRIVRFMKERLAVADDPRRLGKPLKGVLREFWRFRVNDYRVLCRIDDGRLLVLVVRVGDRKAIYQ